MPRYLVDENPPRSLVRMLRDSGLEASHVNDVGYRGKIEPGQVRFRLKPSDRKS